VLLLNDSSAEFLSNVNKNSQVSSPAINALGTPAINQETVELRVLGLKLHLSLHFIVVVVFQILFCGRIFKEIEQVEYVLWLFFFSVLDRHIQVWKLGKLGLEPWDPGKSGSLAFEGIDDRVEPLCSLDPLLLLETKRMVEFGILGFEFGVKVISVELLFFFHFSSVFFFLPIFFFLWLLLLILWLGWIFKFFSRCIFLLYLFNLFLLTWRTVKVENLTVCFEPI
jgi:hypothetical protein